MDALLEARKGMLTNLNKLEETLGTIVKDAEGLKQNSGGS